MSEKSNRGSVVLPVVMFLIGALVGVMGFALYGTLSKNPVLVRSGGGGSTDVALMRSAARDGTLDAIATMQAGGGPQPATPTPEMTPTPLPKSALSLRDANRLGKTDAPVTVVEFSDFQ